MGAGYAVRPIVQTIGGEDFPYVLPNWSFWRSDRQDLLNDAIEANNEETIWHVHCDPPGLASVLRRSCPSAKIILDVHDVTWGWGAEPTELDSLDLKAADHVIVPSQAYKRRSPHKSTTLIRSGYMNTVPHTGYIGGFVYEGGLSNGGWRDHREIFRKLSKIQPVYAYSAEADRVGPYYEAAGISIQNVDYFAMPDALAKHNYSLVIGPTESNPRYLSAWPNKYAESLASGLPILTCGIPEVAEHVRRTKCGRAYFSFDEMLEDAKTLPFPEAFKEGIETARNELSPATVAGLLDKVYSSVLGMNRL